MTLIWRVWIVLLLTGCAAGGGSYNFDMTATPLQMAAGQGDKSTGYKPPTPDLKKVKALVEAGADVNAKNAWGSALHSAVRTGNLEIVKYLIEHGAILDLPDNAGITPLMWAAKMGKLDVVKLLVGRGANVNAVASLNHWTPLTEAAYSGNYEMLTYLISNGADVARQAGAAYVEAANGMGLMYKPDEKKGQVQGGAQKEKRTYEYVAILDLLKSKGASVNSVDKNGMTALHTAAMVGNVKVIKYFLKSGVDPKIEAPYLGTPLACAIRNKTSYEGTLRSDTPIAGMSGQNWENYKNYLKETVPRLNETIAVLTPLTTPNVAKTNPVVPGGMAITSNVRTASLGATPARGQTQSTQTQNAESGGFGDQVKDTLAQCAKLKTALYGCEKLPWPASTGCSAMAKSQYSNLVCN